jgi:hypothetical protein
MKPEIQIVEQIMVEKEVRTEPKVKTSKGRRNNNRKNSNGRTTQIIKVQVPNTFPPIYYNKTIFHK